MLKRIGLFLLTNLLVIITVGIILSILQGVFGISGSGITGLAILCGVFGMVGAFISLALSRIVAKSVYNIYVIEPDDPNFQYRELYNMVVRLSRQANLPSVPEVGIYQSPEPNAFATGPTKNRSIVAFSTGLLASMNKEEVEAVAGHEISHIANGDMVTMTLLTGIANALVMFLARIIATVIDNALRGDDNEGGLGFFGYIMVVSLLETFFMLLASIPIAAFSRYREFRADEGSAKLTSPRTMANALRAIARAAGMPTPKDSFAIAKINSNRKVSLFSTHPSIEDRIARLEQMM
ncbi:MAG: Protease HtpX [Spirochaetes bacterium ADurb.Bin218]|jgi:heat shock protein HtpX|nr:MAG: Protease HtpX [Spirochaetes bacterium ADurb.Bin218]HOK93558.1 protease HtpX [Spirochaetota bacterium]HOQ11858.1 protease HtpX [Spirochaetota bacterium]HOV09545.1 protease HtpX [Spirochaetota bacterium]HPD76833.1 protease HtpX [Spirochaetota bacterium]